MLTLQDYYTLADAAKALRTHRQRIGKLVALTGITLTPIGGALVMTASQFAVVKAAHKKTPFGKPGRPPKRPSIN